MIPRNLYNVCFQRELARFNTYVCLWNGTNSCVNTLPYVFQNFNNVFVGLSAKPSGRFKFQYGILNWRLGTTYHVLTCYVRLYVWIAGVRTGTGSTVPVQYRYVPSPRYRYRTYRTSTVHTLPGVRIEPQDATVATHIPNGLPVVDYVRRTYVPYSSRVATANKARPHARSKRKKKNKGFSCRDSLSDCAGKEESNTNKQGIDQPHGRRKPATAKHQVIMTGNSSYLNVLSCTPVNASQPAKSNGPSCASQDRFWDPLEDVRRSAAISSSSTSHRRLLSSSNKPSNNAAIDYPIVTKDDGDNGSFWNQLDDAHTTFSNRFAIAMRQQQRPFQCW